MPMESLHDLMIDHARDLYDAERQLVKALPNMVRGASDQALKQAFEKHLKETEGHIERLEQILKELGQTARGKKCHGMAGLIAEAKEMLGSEGSQEVKDAGIIAAAQKVEHYEIAAYGCLVAWAEAIGHARIAKLASDSLEEEKAADHGLSEIAESHIGDLSAAAARE
jgi:ferritin-like metal-binding protein YciE